MAEDRNTLLGVLAVQRGFASAADVLAASVSVSMDPMRSLADELWESGVLQRPRAQELEGLAEQQIAACGGDLDKAIEANGGTAVLQEGFRRGDGAAPVVPPSAASDFGDEDDEPTRVLDWDRAARKTVEGNKK